MFYTKTSLKIRVSIENFELWDLITLNYPLITAKIYSVSSPYGIISSCKKITKKGQTVQKI